MPGPHLLPCSPGPASELTHHSIGGTPCPPCATHFYAFSYSIPTTSPVTWVLSVSIYTDEGNGTWGGSNLSKATRQSSLVAPGPAFFSQNPGLPGGESPGSDITYAQAAAQLSPPWLGAPGRGAWEGGGSPAWVWPGKEGCVLAALGRAAGHSKEARHLTQPLGRADPTDANRAAFPLASCSL